MSRFESVVLLALGLVLIKGLLDFLRIELHRRRLAQSFGCKPVKTYKQYDKLLGLGFLYQNIRDFQGQTYLESWGQHLAKTGKTFEFARLGQRILVTSDPDNLKAILATSFDDFEKGPRLRAAFAPLMGNGIFGADGKDWHDARALIRPSFAKSELNDTQRFETHFQGFLRLLPADGVAINLQGLLNRLTMDTATDLLFGRSTGSLSTSEDSEATRFSSAADIALQAVFRDIILPRFGRLIDRQNSKGARKYVHKTISHYVQEALETRSKKGHEGVHPPGQSADKRKGYVFLEHLMEKTNSVDVLRDQSLSALFGARETTASLLSNLLYVLARRPEILAKLRSEALQLCDRSLDQETLKNVPYLSQCINETLRLYPVIPINARCCNKDTILPRGGGNGPSPILVRKGTQINMILYAMHRDKEYYGDDAENFNPERWEALKPGWSFLPFSGGPRQCVGQQLALTEATYTMLRILQTFKTITAADDEPWKENLSVTLSCASGCNVRLYRA